MRNLAQNEATTQRLSEPRLSLRGIAPCAITAIPRHNVSRAGSQLLKV